MFWKRKNESTKSELGIILNVPMPAKKEFETMLELLRDAEKYDSAGGLKASHNILNDLKEYITDFQNKNIPK